jgi:SIR2-like domain
MNVNADDESYLVKSIKIGEAMLILGAGASFSSANSRGQPVKVGRQLAKQLAERAGLTYLQDSLTDVLGAVRGQTLSDEIIKKILVDEYKGIRPSRELKNLFKLVWKRVYTWNIDDSIENCEGIRAQTRRYYNGMIDRAVEFEGLDVLHVVHLHGDIVKPEHGFILTEAEYAAAIKSKKHYWYQRMAQDYLGHCPIFIGSTIEEPILAAELERAKRETGISGKAFLIIPESLSPIKTASLKGKGIVHINATLEQFGKWIESKLPTGTSPAEILAETAKYAPSILDQLTKKELDIATYVRPIVLADLHKSIKNRSTSDLTLMARQFLRGFPPHWTIAASDIPVALEASKALFSELADAVSQNKRLFVVAGQSGSGKTTALLMCLLRYIQENPKVNLFEIRGDVKSLGAAFRLLRRLYSGSCIVYIGDLFVFGDG